MSTLSKVENLRKQAVELLLAERAQIDEKLSVFGHGAQKNNKAGPRTSHTKAAHKCGKCGSQKHNARTCAVAKVEGGIDEPRKEDV